MKTTEITLPLIVLAASALLFSCANGADIKSTGSIDESTAVKIGQLSGADIIVIGRINRVGGQFYLNIKLITVENAEIIRSSIAQAPDATGFLEMANQSVYKLF